MDLKYYEPWINFNKENYSSETNWTSLNLNKLLVCPCLVLGKGKYKFKHIREVLKTDPKYVKLLLQNKADIKLDEEQLDFLKQQIPLLIQEEILKTETYLTTLKEVI